MTKVCTKCHKEYPATLEFFYIHSLGKHGLRPRCKSCLSKIAKEYRQSENGKQVCQRIGRIGSLRRKYDITPEQYDKMLEAQNSVCAVCKEVSSDGRALSVDHNHKTNKVRKLLCSRCNLLLGKAKEDIAILYSLINYIKNEESKNS